LTLDPLRRPRETNNRSPRQRVVGVRDATVSKNKALGNRDRVDARRNASCTFRDAGTTPLAMCEKLLVIDSSKMIQAAACRQRAAWEEIVAVHLQIPPALPP